MTAVLAVPGDLATPTGGYAYARRVLAEADGAGWPLRHLALPDGFPAPDAEALEETARRLAAVPADTVLIVDGLAYGVLPTALLARVQAPLLALCHHPLARETGLAPARAAALAVAERAALARAAAVVATSEATAAELRADYGVAHVHVAPPGTDPQPPAQGSGQGSGQGAPVILAVGSLVPRKGFATLLQALAACRKLPWSCAVIGAADRDPAEAARLAALARDLGLDGRVRFEGALEAAALHRRYARADLFALPSAHEGFGMAFAEAIAHGLPTLAPDIPAVRGATAGGALMLPPDPAAWGRALGRLIRNPAERAALAAQARAAADRLPRWPATLAALRRAAEAAQRHRP